jgi:transposase
VDTFLAHNASKESAMGRRQKHRRFSPEFKAEAVRLVTTTDESVATIARELGVSTGSLKTWVEAARPQPRQPLTEDERSELTRLRREIRRVEMERDILKKATAFFARQSE